jgi:hypothetical protein
MSIPPPQKPRELAIGSGKQRAFAAVAGRLGACAVVSEPTLAAAQASEYLLGRTARRTFERRELIQIASLNPTAAIPFLVRYSAGAEKHIDSLLAQPKPVSRFNK